MFHSVETMRLLDTLSSCAAFVAFPAVEGGNAEWFKVDWVDGSGEVRDEIVVCLSVIEGEDAGDATLHTYASLKERGVTFYQFAKFDPESVDAKPLV